MEVEVVKLIPEDWENFKTIRLKALSANPTAFGSSYKQEVNRPEEIWKQKLATSWVYAAIVENQFVGIARVLFELGEHVQHVASIVSLFIDPAYRRQGIGKKIIRKIISDLHDQKVIVKIILTVNADQKPAIKLFEKVGFKTIGIAKYGVKVNQTYYNQLHMELIFKDKL
ncbi:MAG: GNAT family N-acetyltransferase [bacterium]|nr:GNAT family N-acetyltransferase [bacterium]